MRGISEKQSVMLSLNSPEARVPKDHPLRQIKTHSRSGFETFVGKVWSDGFVCGEAFDSSRNGSQIASFDRPVFSTKRKAIL